MDGRSGLAGKASHGSLTVSPRLRRRSGLAGLVMLLLGSAWQAGCSDPDRAGDTHTSPNDPASSVSVTECLTGRSLAEHLRFATRSEAEELLSRPDDWARQLSPFDIGARQKTLEATSLETFLEFVGSAARTWTEEEKAYWGELVDELSESMVGLNLTMADVFLVKTSGHEEFGFAYHRNGGIVLPEGRVAISGQDRRSDLFLLAHEVFHYLGSQNSSTRDALFALLGFERVEQVDLPSALDTRRLSNPDAHTYQHALSVRSEGRVVRVVPLIQSTLPLGEIISLPQDGRPTLLSHIEVVLVPVDVMSGSVLDGSAGDPGTTYGVDETDWQSKTQRNTSYSIHPEEVMADNFALLMEWRRTGSVPTEAPGGFPVNDVDLLRRIDELLTAGC